ncbi:MAG: alpha/beta hydrolase [Candidatus Obscuribacterales bacterium]|nr:alpha/beta hydrolase [Steroidobacteraceae bacterium]
MQRVLVGVLAVTCAALSGALSGCAASSSSASAATSTAAALPNVNITADVVYGHKDGMALFYDVFTPRKANGSAVLYMVSGGWFSSWREPQQRIAGFQLLLDRGITVIAVHHGSAPRFKVPEAVADVRRAVRHVRANAIKYRIDASRLGVWGGSAGGHLSLMLGLASDNGNAASKDPIEQVANNVKAVVAYYPPVDLRRMTGPSERFPALDFDNKLAAAISPLLFVDKADPPTLIIHGTADTLVPIASGRSIYEALKQAGVTTEFIVIDGGDHGFTNPDHRAQATLAMAEWFAAKL